ncbi:MAG: hypothetical protein J6C64_13490 [Lachnospiraceae bacterium]|nr:hypothetical protein [Lachnospiraceae bacterium]
MKKKLARITFILLLIITFYFISAVLSIKSSHGIDQKESMYWQPHDSIDVVMMGTSHIHCNINTGLLWENYGIAAYDYSGAEQPLWMTYYYLKELYKYQNPEVIVLDLYAPARFKEDYQYTWISENIHGMHFSLNKLQMLAVSVEPEKLFNYFPSFMVYHSRYDDLEADDFDHFFWNSDQMESFKGYTPYLKRTPQAKPVINEKRADGFTSKSLKYLNKIIECTKEHNTELILIATPYIATDEDTRTYNQAAEIARENGLLFINYNEYYDEIGLNLTEDFNDESHLNYWGSCKFTDYLAQLLSSYEQIPDRRGQEGYESWDENAQIISDYVKQNSSGGRNDSES